MNPWIPLFGDVGISPYFALIAFGLTVGTMVLRREARREGLPVRDVFDITLAVVPLGILGARLLVVLDNPGLYFQAPWRLLHPSAGWVSYGALLGTVVAVSVGSWIKGIDPWRVLDLFAPAMPLGHAFARMGCLAAGCCHGRPADWPFGVNVPWAVRYYTHGRFPESLLAVPLHPSPLYESLAALLLFVGASRLRAHRPWPGAMFAWLMGAYGIVRIVLEVFRGDLERGIWAGGWITTAQLTGLFLVAAGLGIWRYRKATCTPS